MTGMYRYAIDASRPPEYGGGRCNLLVRRSGGQVQLLFHCDPETGAILTDAQVRALAEALTAAMDAT